MNAIPDRLGELTAEDSQMDLVDGKFLLDKYYEVVKLRAGQSLALFLVYGLALRESKTFLDSSSLLAIVVPVAAWFLDRTARRHYGAPLAYASFRHESRLKDSEELSGSSINVPDIIFDFRRKYHQTLRDILNEGLGEEDRRQKFLTWYTKKDQLIPALVFSAFFVLAVVFHYFN
jgi:hypothetical protein